MLHLQDVLQLKTDEEIQAIVRQHWATLVPPLLLAFILLVVPFFMLFPLFAMGIIGMVIFAAAVALGIAVAVHSFIMWDADAFIVTTLRVVDVDQRGIFSRFVTEALLSSIQDISWNRKGMIETMLGVGSLSVQTAGANARIEATRIPRPERVQELINDLRNRTTPKKENVTPERSKLLRVIHAILDGYSVEELQRIETVLKARERSASANAFFSGDVATKE